MRKHGWQLPYHPLQVVAVAVFLSLGFAFYVFFVPFIGKKILQYVVMGIYTILVISVFRLYIWCAAADPADPGVFKSKKYLHFPENEKQTRLKDSKLGGESTSSFHNANASNLRGKSLDKDAMDTDKNTSSSCFMGLIAFVPCALICNSCSPHVESSEQQSIEDGLFYCSLCEVEVFKYSKHCRVCDKCVNRFDHHCRWLNNCVGKRNYRKFFTLMISSLLLLILQWSTGILVLVCCFLERKQFSVDVASKLGSSFTLVPFVIVVALCTILAMIATLPLAQLLFFHVLLIKKGISTYDYIIALREQEQEQQGIGVHQSPQMSPTSSLTGLSSTSSFTTFRRGAWCTPPHLFIEDQFDVVASETGSVSSFGKKLGRDEPIKKKNPGAVKISPWALARLNAEDVSKAAAEARKMSKILQPVLRQDADDRFGSCDGRMIPRPDSNRLSGNKRVRLPADLSVNPLMTISAKSGDKSLAPLQLEARNAFQTSRVASSPESSIDSTDIHPFRVSSSGPEDARQLTATHNGILLSRTTSDGYEASGGEDSDRVPPRNIDQRSTYWSNLFFGSSYHNLNASSSSTMLTRQSFDP